MISFAIENLIPVSPWESLGACGKPWEFLGVSGRQWEGRGVLGSPLEALGGPEGLLGLQGNGERIEFEECIPLEQHMGARRGKSVRDFVGE